MTDRWAPPATTVVTGAAGWLGQALMHRLAAEGRRVRALVHDVAEAAQVPGESDVAVGDVADRAIVDRLFDGVGADTDVIHTAGVIHPKRVSEFFMVNTRGTENMVAAARRAGVRRFVHVSSNSPFGTNPHPADVFR